MYWDTEGLEIRWGRQQWKGAGELVWKVTSSYLLSI